MNVRAISLRRDHRTGRCTVAIWADGRPQPLVVIDESSDRIDCKVDFGRRGCTAPAHPTRIAWWIATHTPAGLMALGMFTGVVLCAVAILFVL